VKEHLI
jgi:serine/threonine protein phosphatase PrpC